MKLSIKMELCNILMLISIPLLISCNKDASTLDESLSFDRPVKSHSIGLKGQTIQLGDNFNSLQSHRVITPSAFGELFGSDTAMDSLASGYNFVWHIYAMDNYQNFMMIGVSNGIVKAIYSMALEMRYLNGIKIGSSIGDCTQALSSYSPKVSSSKITFEDQENNVTSTLYFDGLETTQLFGLLVMSKDVIANQISIVVEKSYEYQLLHFTNASRVRHSASILLWDSNVSMSSKLHSQDMARQNYFSHTSTDDRTPWVRLKAQGVTYSKAAENIAKGQPNAIEVHHSWLNSPGHRKNLLTPDWTYFGCGTFYKTSRLWTEMFYN